MAERAVKQSLLLLLDVRQQALGEGSFRRKSLQILDRLPELLSILIDEDSGARRVATLEALSDIIARIDPQDEKQLCLQLNKLGVVVAVIMCLEATPTSDEHVLAAGLVLLSNVALIEGGSAMVIESGGTPLLCRLLCGLDGRTATPSVRQAPLPSLSVQRVAVAALHGLTREQAGRAAVPLAVRGVLMERLQKLAKSDAAAHRHAQGALLSLRRLRRKPAGRLMSQKAKEGAALAAIQDALTQADDEKQRQLDAMERARLATGLVRNRAARRLQAAYRLQRDACAGADALRVQNKALAFIRSTWRGRQRHIAAKFGAKLRARAQASLAQRLAQRSADLPSEEAELLLHLFEDQGLVEASEAAAISPAEKRRRERLERRARRTAAARSCAIGCLRVIFMAPLFEWIRRLLLSFVRKATRLDTYIPEAVRFTVAWTYQHHRRPFIRAVFLITYSSLYMGAIPVMMNYLFNVALPNSQKGMDCMLDTTLMISLIVFGYASVVQVKYILSISKMDGAGFVPAFQKQLTVHLCKVDQSHRDSFNETELITVIEKDTSTLNKVILAVFDMFGNVIELGILLPSLAFLSVELTIVVLVAIPTFLWLQLRQGIFIVAAAKALR